MIDREKVIKAIEICYSRKHSCDKCEYFHADDCNDELMHDALELLRTGSAQTEKGGEVV